MPRFNIVKKTQKNKSFRVSSIEGMFDVPVSNEISHAWSGNIEIENKDWNIGLIYGPSGSGKSTIANDIFGDSFFYKNNWSEKKSIVDCFPENMKIDEIVSIMNSVGFSSPPSWIKPYNVLSTGEKFRVDLARSIAEKKDLIVFDEFTSVVDREVAKAGSFAVGKMIKKSGKKFIALSCHYDILDWLLPDWTYQPDVNEFKWRNLRRPEIKLDLFRVHYKAWELFKKHHYMTSKLNIAAQCFVCEWNGTPVGFTSSLPLVGRVKNIWRGHRTVVLPDYQGIGIGNAMIEMMAEHYKDKGCRYRGTTAHPALISYRIKSDKWRLKQSSTSSKAGSRLRPIKSTAAGRLTATFEYIG